MSERTRPDAGIEVRGVSRVFEGNVRALRSVDLEVRRGEFVAITGPSGCGKSTLLHLVASLDVPTSGTVSVGGLDLSRVRDISRFRREDVGLVFQLHNLLPQQPVVANVEVAMFGGPLRRDARRQRALQLLADVELDGREFRRPTQLSGGERQRVAIARALANDPQFLLADEPTGSLDSVSSKRVVELFQRVHAAGKTIVLVTHDHAVAASADRTIEMQDGKILATVG